MLKLTYKSEYSRSRLALIDFAPVAIRRRLTPGRPTAPGIPPELVAAVSASIAAAALNPPSGTEGTATSLACSRHGELDMAGAIHRRVAAQRCAVQGVVKPSKIASSKLRAGNAAAARDRWVDAQAGQAR